MNDMMNLTITRADYTHPGHPITIAAFIVQAFPDITSAFKMGQEYPEALVSLEVPGAGGNVYAALDFLKRAAIDFDAAVAWANGRWAEETESAFRDRREVGQSQADRLAEVVGVKVKGWCGLEAIA